MIVRRAIERGNVMGAEMAAREIALSLGEALQLVLLYAAYKPRKFERAAMRWFTRYVTEAEPDLLRAQIALAALAELRCGSDAARELLVKLALDVRQWTAAILWRRVRLD